MDDPRSTEETILDASILSALTGAAQNIQTLYGEEQTEVLVTKAVVCFEYVDDKGEASWGYRRVRASWFDVGGSAVMLGGALDCAWHDENDDE
jgi:hypothetical protein